jgi:hypothetical protein
LPPNCLHDGEVDILPHAFLQGVAPESLARIQSSLLQRLDEPALCPQSGTARDLGQEILLYFLQRVDVHIGRRALAMPLSRLAMLFERANDSTQLRSALYDFSDWAAVFLPADADWIDPISRSLMSLEDAQIRQIVRALCRSESGDGQPVSGALDRLMPPRGRSPMEKERDARIPTLLCAALTRCILDRLDAERPHAVRLLRASAHTADERRSALSRVTSAFDACVRLDADRLIPAALLSAYRDILLVKTVLLACTVQMADAAPLKIAGLFEYPGMVGEDARFTVEQLLADGHSRGVYTQQVPPGRQADSVPGQSFAGTKRWHAPGPRHEAILARELCRFPPPPSDLVLVELHSVGDAPQGLAVGRQFHADAIARTGVSFSVCGVTRHGATVVHTAFQPRMLPPQRDATVLQALAALERLAGNDTEPLTRIMTQQTSGALCAGLQQLGATSPIRMSDGVAFIPGGTASLHFDLVRRPDGRYRIEGKIDFSALECGTRICPDGVEPGRLDPSRSYFTAGVKLLVSPVDQRVDMLEPMEFAYQFAASNESHITGVRV